MLTKTDLSQIRKVVQSETRIIVKGELKPIKQDSAQIRKDIKVIVSLFGREYVELRRRVERIEQHLGIAA